MELKKFVENNDFSSGLPDGDTIIEIASTQVEQISFIGSNGKEKIAYKLSLANGKSYTVPKTVMAKIKDLSLKGASKVRVTRTGTLLDTEYTVIAI